jgi:hypothetical protein
MMIEDHIMPLENISFYKMLPPISLLQLIAYPLNGVMGTHCT